ncbi:PAS domain-containing sensor histidine kinase [Dyadobacter luticola]|nr:PAS domain-containing protein [Dyadobacter luticola]
MATSIKPFSPDDQTEITRLEAALTAAGVGTWEFNPEKDEFKLCERFKAIFGFPFQDTISFNELLQQISEEDRELVRSRTEQAFEKGDLFDFEFRIVREKEGEPVWLNFKGQGSSTAHTLAGIVTDVTKFIKTTQETAEVTRQLRAHEAELNKTIHRFESLIAEAPVAICLFTGKDMIVELANAPMVGYWGKDMSVIGKPLREAMPELDGQPFHQLLADILVTKQAHVAKDARVDIEVDGVLGTYYFDFTYKPLLDENGEVYTIINISIDVTQRVLAERALRESENKLRSIVNTAPVAIGLFVGRDLIIEMPNQSFIDIVGKGPDITGKSLSQVMPELESQAFLEILDEVYTTGKSYKTSGTQVEIVRNGELTQNFYNITYTPIFDENGEVYAILDIAIDVTDKMQEQMKVEESQMQLLTLFEQSPAAIAVIAKEDLTFTMANPFYARLVGRTVDQIVGKPMRKALPELDGQGFDAILERVIETGEPFIATEQSVDLMKDNVLQTLYVNMTYQPKRDLDGQVSGVLVVATDVTTQVVSRQKIEDAENTLRGAVELAELGTWQIDLSTGMIEVSDRLKHWFGLGEEALITPEHVFDAIYQQDLDRIQKKIATAIADHGDQIYDIEFTIKPGEKRNERVLHTQGLVLYNAEKVPYKVIGSVQDVTVQQKMMLALEQQVQHRTEELESTNEELAAINEEYMALNEDLSLSNDLLSRSNENLQQFAYIASHDLQEPLRKIQSFGDLLKNRFAGNLGAGAEYIDRMQASAKRMSSLIDDLLSFSRVSTNKDLTTPVNLDEVISSALLDLDLAIQQSKAKLSIGALPTVHGDSSQLVQLFQNIISNALKFQEPDSTPVINISARTIPSQDLPESVRPARQCEAYYQIDVEDNGIGFDERYTDRIFQIFQRLQGRSQFTGTGIGLAICQKVAINHGGAITANSQVGQGSTFKVFLPVE